MVRVPGLHRGKPCLWLACGLALLLAHQSPAEDCIPGGFRPEKSFAGRTNPQAGHELKHKARVLKAVQAQGETAKEQAQARTRRERAVR